MSLSESTLVNWTKRSSDHEEEKCERARRMISGAIHAHPSLQGRAYQIISQGSYENNTNVRNESDVDVCVVMTDVFNYSLAYAAGETHESVGISASSRVYADDKAEVGRALRATFGRGVEEGSKAFEVHSTATSRVDADVVAAWRFRGYESRRNGQVSYREGITFWSTSGQQIINFPEQHKTNGVNKNTRTNRAFKRAVRIVKRMRYDLLSQGDPAGDGVSSFFIECAMYNLPDSTYTKHSSWKATVRDALEQMAGAQGAAEWVEVSGYKWLFRPTYRLAAKWTEGQMQAFARVALGML